MSTSDVNLNVTPAAVAAAAARPAMSAAMRKESLAGIIAGMLQKYSARKEVTAHSLTRTRSTGLVKASSALVFGEPCTG